MSWINWLKASDLVTAGPDETVATAVDRMVSRQVGSLLVVEKDRLTGIFSERDVLTRVIAAGRDPATTRLGDVCTPDPKVVREDAELSECARLIKEYGFRHLPVIDPQGRPVGVISVRDFSRYALDELETLITKAYREKRREQMVDPYELVSTSVDR